MRHNKSIGEYLAFLSIKYDVDPEKFFNSILKAGENKKSKCDHLSIEYRGKTGTEQIFLMTNDSGVVAQFRIPDDFLLRRDAPLTKFMETDMIRRHLFKKNNASHSHFIRDLRSGMNHVNLKAKILEIGEPSRVVTRFGNYANVAKALIGDETGTINLCLWNDQIESVAVGDIVQIANARASSFRGERQLIVGVRGTLNNVEDFEPQMASTGLLTVKT